MADWEESALPLAEKNNIDFWMIFGVSGHT